MTLVLQISTLLKHVCLFAPLAILKMVTNVHQLHNLVRLINSLMHIVLNVKPAEVHALLVLEHQRSVQIVFKDLI